MIKAKKKVDVLISMPWFGVYMAEVLNDVWLFVYTRFASTITVIGF